MVTRFDALVDAVVRYSGYTEPTSNLYQGRNPGGLKATSLRHVKDSQGYRVFQSCIDGEQALRFDLALKITGKSWAELKPTSTLEQLAEAYGLENTYADRWAKFLRAALGDQSVSSKTELIYFNEDK